MNAAEVIQRCCRIKAKQRKLETLLQDLIDSVEKGIKKGRLSVKAMAEVDRIQTIWLLREAKIVPSLKDGHLRVKRLLGPAKPGELEKQHKAPI